MDNDFVYFIRNFSRFTVMVDDCSKSRFGFCILFALHEVLKHKIAAIAATAEAVIIIDFFIITPLIA